jgi:hypothetical protein
LLWPSIDSPKIDCLFVRREKEGGGFFQPGGQETKGKERNRVIDLQKFIKFAKKNCFLMWDGSENMRNIEIKLEIGTLFTKAW